MPDRRFALVAHGQDRNQFKKVPRNTVIHFIVCGVAPTNSFVRKQVQETSRHLERTIAHMERTYAMPS